MVMLRSYARRLRGRILDRIVRGPAAVTRERYDDERMRCPKQRVQNITIYGDPRFRERVTEALERLEHAYPYGYALVQRYMHAIESEDISPGFKVQGPSLAGFGARSEKTTPEGDLPVTPERYAAFLVRVAANRRRALLHARKSPQAESMCRQKEEKTMKLLLRARGF